MPIGGKKARALTSFLKKKCSSCVVEKRGKGEKSSVFFEKTFLFELFGSYYLIGLPYKFYALAHEPGRISDQANDLLGNLINH